MDANAHLEFLRQNQPLPLEPELSSEAADAFERARAYFETHTDDRCVALLIGAVNADSGFGMYQMVDAALENQSKDVVHAEIRKALEQGRESNLMWLLEWASTFEMFDLEPLVRPHVEHPSPDISIAAKSFLNLRSEALGQDPEFPDLFE